MEHKTKKDLQITVMSRVPIDEEGRSTVDIYVHLPSRNRFVRWIRAGDILDDKKRNKLLRHPDPRLYCPADQWGQRFSMTKDLNRPVKTGDEVKDVVTDIFIKTLEDKDDQRQSIEKLASLAEDLTNTVMKDLKKYEAKLKDSLDNIDRLEDSNAIRALATLFAMANGFDSKSSMLEINSAVLFMDSPLCNFTSEEIEKYYSNPFQPDTAFMTAYKKHPVDAYMVAYEKFKFMSDTSLQIILNHHEYHCGGGFPKGVRTRSLPDLVKIVSCAVDCFERIKRHELHGVKKGYEEVLLELYEPDLEPHEKRHSQGMVDKILKHLGLKIKQVA